MDIFSIWCKICALFNSLLALCQGIAILATNLTTISMNNIIIKDKIESLVGDPAEPCPECGPPNEGLVAEQAVTAQMAETTADMQVATAELQAKTAVIREKLGAVAIKADAEKEATPTPVRG